MLKRELLNLIAEIEEEACDRVWLHRKTPEDYKSPNLRPIIQEVLDKYNLKFGEQDNFDYHYWEGVLACARFLIYKAEGDAILRESVDIDDIRTYGGNFGLLDS